MLFPQQFFTWDLAAAEDIRAHHFDVLDHIKPRPSYILVGTGAQKHFLDEAVIGKLKSYGVRFDVLDTVGAGEQFQAVSTFNVASEDGQNLVAFLLPGVRSEEQI